MDTSFKSLSNGYWVAWYANSFEDRENEFFPQAVLDADISAMHKTGNFPELWYGHKSWAKLGRALTAFRIGRFAIAIGRWYNTPLAKAMRAKIEARNDWQMSFGFRYADRKDGVFEGVRTFEISVLPPGLAANPYTKFSTKVKAMNVHNPQALAAIRKSLGDLGFEPDSIIDMLQTQATEKAKALEAAQVASKAMGDKPGAAVMTDGKPYDMPMGEEKMDELKGQMQRYMDGKMDEMAERIVAKVLEQIMDSKPQMAEEEDEDEVEALVEEAMVDEMPEAKSLEPVVLEGMAMIAKTLSDMQKQLASVQADQARTKQLQTAPPNVAAMMADVPVFNPSGRANAISNYVGIHPGNVN